MEKEEDDRITRWKDVRQHEKYWTESRRGDGQGDVEKEDHQSYRRPYMMGKEEDHQCTIYPHYMQADNSMYLCNYIRL